MEMSEKFKRWVIASRADFGTPWQPSVDVYRTRNGWLLKFDLAGVRPEDVAVSMQGCRISVSGIRRDWTLEEGCTHYSMEISYNRFQRSIELPCDIQNARMNLEYRDGILMVRVVTEE
jgi:HSP20 family protein